MRTSSSLLSPEHRAALREAATAAVPAALAAARADDEEAALSLCGQGATFAVASDTELTELRRTLEPLYADLRSDPDTKAALDTITSLKSRDRRIGRGADLRVHRAAGYGVSHSGGSLRDDADTGRLAHGRDHGGGLGGGRTVREGGLSSRPANT